MQAAARIDATALQDAAFDGFRARLRQDVILAKTNWFGVGGRADWLFKPADVQDLSTFLNVLPRDMPVMVLGVGSNVIVRDGGIRGVVIKLGRGFTGIEIDDGLVSAGAAALDVHVADVACEHGLTGLEFLIGIPGTIGGAVRMNGGAYGSDMSQVCQKLELVQRDGTVVRRDASELDFSYRKSNIADGMIVTRAWMRGAAGDKAQIAARMKEISAAREETQPIRMRTGGSTFKNPQGHKAWQLVDAAGCRGLKMGGAQISELHCNFMINTGGASAADLEALGDAVIEKVKAHSGVTLEWEIKRIGDA